jgi:hypothetical protein
LMGLKGLQQRGEFQRCVTLASKAYVLDLRKSAISSSRATSAPGTTGFAAAEDLGLAVCVMPGTELAFAQEIASLSNSLLSWKARIVNYRTAIFRQVNKDKHWSHHDALEFPDGRTELLTHLCEGQQATVLQLPAQPTTAAEADAQKRVANVG